MQKLFCPLVFTSLTSVCIWTLLTNCSVTSAAPTTIETASEEDKWSSFTERSEADKWSRFTETSDADKWSSLTETSEEDKWSSFTETSEEDKWSSFTETSEDKWSSLTETSEEDKWSRFTEWYNEAEQWIDETSVSSQDIVNDWMEEDYKSVKEWIENSSDMTQEKFKTLERDARMYLEEVHDEIQSFTESLKDRFHSIVNPVKMENYVLETVCLIAGVKGCAECRSTDKTSHKAIVCYVCCDNSTEDNPLPPPSQDDSSSKMTQWFIETFNWMGLHAVYQYVTPQRKERQNGASVISVIENFNSRFSKKPITLKKILNSTVYSNSTFKNEDICGYYTNSKEGRIVGGSHVDSTGLYPWQLSLSTSMYGMFYQHRCGATLLSSRWVLTAAHCLQEVGLHTTVVLGGFLSQNNHDVAQIIKVERAFPHPHFDAALFEQDIALLRLERAVQFTSLLLPACLPPPHADYSGKTAVLTGWGREWDKGPLTDQLHKVELPVITNEVCMRWYRQSKSPQNIPVRTFLCAGVKDGTKDACSGDSGGPLVNYREDERAEIIGIVSWGIGCGSAGRPGVYTRVTKYTGWIEETMREADAEEEEGDAEEEEGDAEEGEGDAEEKEGDAEEGEGEAQNDVVQE